LPKKDFNKTSYFILRAFPSEKEMDVQLLEIKIDNRQFGEMWQSLLEHYRLVSILGN